MPAALRSTIVGGLGARELVRLTDTWTDLNSRVALAAGGMEHGAAVMQRLGEVARRTYSSLEQTAEGYLLNATATGVSAKISEALVIMADNFDKTADVALQLAGVIAGALIGRSLLKMISTLGLRHAA